MKCLTLYERDIVLVRYRIETFHFEIKLSSIFVFDSGTAGIPPGGLKIEHKTPNKLIKKIEKMRNFRMKQVLKVVNLTR